MRTNSSRPSKESSGSGHHHHHHHKHNKRDSAKSSNVNRVDFCNLRGTPPQDEDDSLVANNPFPIDADMMMNWKLREVAMYKQQQKLNNYLKSQQNLLHSNQNTDR